MIISKKERNLFYLFIVTLFFGGEYLINSNPNTKHTLPIEKKEHLIVNTNQNDLYLYKNKKTFDVHNLTKYFDKNYKDYYHVFNLSTDESVNAVALGTDKLFHLTNHFLEGYSPFKTTKIWVPLYTLGTKKRYQLDHISHKGYKEIWQTSSEAFKYTRGDCEDHAIALADWLIELGEDARVVTGKYEKGGHAWVVLFKNNKEYILEATQKNRLHNPYPQAKYLPKYKPENMFNQDNFWHNTGTVNTTKYSSNKWIKKSKYIRDAKNKILDLNI